MSSRTLTVKKQLDKKMKDPAKHRKGDPDGDRHKKLFKKIYENSKPRLFPIRNRETLLQLTPAKNLKHCNKKDIYVSKKIYWWSYSLYQKTY